MFPKAIKSNAIQKTVITDKANNAILIIQTVYGPAKEFYVGITERVFVGGAGSFRIRFVDATINYGIFAVFVVIIFAFLPHIVRRIPNNHGQRSRFLPRHPLAVFFVEKSELGAFGQI